MYRDIIELKDGLSAAQIAEIRACCIKAHDNRQGCIAIKDVSPTEFVFEGEYKDWQALMTGCLALAKIPQFWQNAKKWYWEDVEPSESGNLLEELRLS